MNVANWQPIETCPPNTWVLTYAPWEDLKFHICRYKPVTKTEDVLVSEKGNFRIYETVERQKRDWDGTSWGGEFWMPLPAPPDQPEGRP